MSPILCVKNLSKRYRIGSSSDVARELRRSFVKAVTKPLRGLLPSNREGMMGAGNGQHAAAVEEIWALKDVSFDVQEGEVVGIIGRNGAGKSTLLKVLSRITEPTAGRVTMKGRLGALLEVGTGFHPELTGRENVYLNGSILGMSRAEIDRQFDAIVDFSGVERFIDTPVKRYSSGMHVRLGFAVAAHLSLDILVVDEVLAVGDVAFQRKCLGTMGDMGRDGRTVLVVSHNMPMIMNLCRRAILLQAGQVVSDGPPADTVQAYLASVQSGAGEVVWPDTASAPGNDVVRLHSVRIRQPGSDGPTADVDIARDVLVEIAYWNLRPGTELYAALWLRTASGSDVLSSANTPAVTLQPDEWGMRAQPAGLFQSVCRLPGGFLNEGGYVITAIVGIRPSETQVLQEDVLTFNVYDTGEMRKEYYGNWLGVVRPKLAWQTEPLRSAAD